MATQAGRESSIHQIGGEAPGGRERRRRPPDRQGNRDTGMPVRSRDRDKKRKEPLQESCTTQEPGLQGNFYFTRPGRKKHTHTHRERERERERKREREILRKPATSTPAASTRHRLPPRESGAAAGAGRSSPPHPRHTRSDTRGGGARCLCAPCRLRFWRGLGLAGVGAGTEAGTRRA